jgi:hypothetical protein
VRKSKTITKNKKLDQTDILQNLQYICKSSGIITSALREGKDVAQLPNGDIIVTEIRVINTQYKWNAKDNRLVVYEDASNNSESVD